MRISGAMCLAVVALIFLTRLTWADDAAIAPFVNDQTIVVVRIDVTRVDPNATLKWCEQQLASHGQDEQTIAAIDSVWAGRTGRATTLLGGLQKAGAKQLYWLISNSDWAHGFSLPSAIDNTRKGIWIVPAPAGADRTAISKLLTAQPTDNGKPVLQSQEVGDVIIAMKPGIQLQKSDAPLIDDWSHALASDAPITIAIVPGAILRQTFEDTIPTLQFADRAVPTTQFTRGVRWGRIMVAAPRQAAASGVIQCIDPQAAGEVSDSINHWVNALKGKPLSLFPYPLTPIENGSQLFTCKADGNRVKLSPEMNALLVPMMVAQLHDSLIAKTRGNMMQLLLGSIMYANTHKEFPPDFTALMKDQDLSPNVTQDLQHPQEQQGFIYIKPPTAATDPKTPVLYEKWDGGLLVGFADGHVETMESRAAVMKLFAGSRP